jgi:hypothetical protein
MEKGKTQLILKYEGETAHEAFDENGVVEPIAKQHDENLSLFVEHGLTDRITLQGNFGWTRGSDSFNSYGGRGPIDFGARYVVLRTARSVVSVYAGGVIAGEGPNTTHSARRAGDPGVEVRLLAGRSGTLWRRHVFGEVQLAQLTSRKLPDETRVETTIGIEPARRWLLLAQTYAGREDQRPVAPLWLKSEWSVIHDVGLWRLQAGWRAAQIGIESPVTRGPVLALWRTF